MRIYGRAIAYFRKDRARILLLLVLIALSVVIGLLQAWPTAVLVDAVLTPNPKSSFFHHLFLAPLPQNKLAQVIGITLIGMFLKIAQDMIWMFRAMLNNRLRYLGLARARGALFAHLASLPPAYHKAHPQGDAIYRLSNDVQGFFGILDTFIACSVAAVTLTAMTAIMLTRSVPLTLFAFSVAPFLILVNVLFGKRILQYSLHAKQADAQYTTFIQRALASLPLIQIFGRQSAELNRFRRSVDHANAANYKLNWQEALYPFLVQLLFALGGAIIFGYGGYLVYRDQFLNPVPHALTVGDLMVFMAYLGSLWDPLCRLTGFFTAISGHRAAVERVLAVLDTPSTITSPENPTILTPQLRALSLHHVSFSYLPISPSMTPSASISPHPVTLSDLSFDFPAGSFTAIVGPSGCGKSTLLNLLVRFHDPTGGTLKLDHHDLRTLDLDHLRKHLALVPQDSVLFPASIAENIAYAYPDATMEEIINAAKQAGADEFIRELPEGYDTVLSENAGNLSGGQRQRLAIARALLSPAPILIFDEPTSALDPAQQRHVLHALRRQTPQRTVILVTHDIPAVRHADQIAVLCQGRLVELGSHEELLALRGSYYDLLHPAPHPPTDPLTLEKAA